MLNARLFVASHVSMEVGVQQTMWLLRGGKDEKSLSVWRSGWRVSIAEVTNQVNCQAEFAKLRYLNTRQKENVQLLEIFLFFFLLSTISLNLYKI